MKKTMKIRFGLFSVNIEQLGAEIGGVFSNDEKKKYLKLKKVIVINGNNIWVDQICKINYDKNML